MSDPGTTLAAWHATVWAMLAAGVRDARAPARLPVLATVGVDGWPQARMVVLRAADAVAGVVEVHTDVLSPKVADLRTTPRAALQVWDAGGRLQIRLRCAVRVLTGAAVQGQWGRVPDLSRLAYGAVPPPGAPVPGPGDYGTEPGPGRFAVLRCEVMAMDVLHLGTPHRRAGFDRADGWRGQWLVP
ncbi:MAG: pyridoxamine 5'-phosphate oxidase [Rhodobacterales bacterium]|nr:pyridoxamine 5'-phosphate oxidase [Rhodobacterales bacterium]NCT13504.1 pyridoxamine 5'-phosphate oxidase [Rhodobacterales bacterium]